MHYRVAIAVYMGGGCMPKVAMLATVKSEGQPSPEACWLLIGLVVSSYRGEEFLDSGERDLNKNLHFFIGMCSNFSLNDTQENSLQVSPIQKLAWPLFLGSLLSSFSPTFKHLATGFLAHLDVLLPFEAFFQVKYPFLIVMNLECTKEGFPNSSKSSFGCPNIPRKS